MKRFGLMIVFSLHAGMSIGNFQHEIPIIEEELMVKDPVSVF